MNIGILCHSHCGGSGCIAVSKAFHLAQRGHRVHLFTKRIPFFARNNTKNIAFHPLRTDFIKGPHVAQLESDWPSEDLQNMAESVINITHWEGLDVLHVHYIMPLAFVAHEVKNRIGDQAPALVATFHGTDVITYGCDTLQGPALTEALIAFDAFTSVSAEHARLAKDTFGIPTDVSLIPNFVDFGRYIPKIPCVHGSKSRILHISNFKPVKDLQGVIRIFASVRERIEAELWLVGNGEEMPTVKEILKELNLLRYTRFFGLVSNVASILPHADLLLMPSSYESFCLAALEAMASGLPVVASHVGGLPDVVLHGKTGFLFPAGEYSTAARLCLQLLTDRGLYCSLSKAARKRAMAFDMETVVGRYITLYKEVVAEKSRCAQSILPVQMQSS